MADERTITRSKQPIAWHPLFPTLLALWFGALFGLGVLAVRVSLLEHVVLASGIDQVLSAAAPPLGIKARLLIALAFALLGGAIGGAIGMLMARSKPSARARRAEAKAAKAARADAVAALAIEAEEPVAPAQDEAPSYFDISALDLGDDMKIEPEAHAEVIEPEVASAAETTVQSAPAFTDEQVLDAVAFSEPESAPEPGCAAAARLTAAKLDSLSHVELIERLAHSLQKRREEGAEAPRLNPAVLEAALAGLDAAVLPAAPQASPAPSYYPPAPEPTAPHFAAPAAVVDQAPEAEEAPAPTYGALHGIPRLADASRPVALFPDQAPAAPRQDSVATERALRDALAALQRMSGAA